jgi:hypothetical protein
MYEDVDSYVVHGRREACHLGRDLCATIREKLSPIGQLEAVKNPYDHFQRPSSDGSTAVNRLVQQLLRRGHSFRQRGHGGAVNARLIVEDGGKTRNRLRRGSTEERYLVGKKVAVWDRVRAKAILMFKKAINPDAGTRLE